MINGLSRILIIDDNPEIHKDFIKILKPAANHKQLDNFEEILLGKQTQNLISLPDFCIKSAYQGEEGIQCVQKSIKSNKRFALAFVDIRIPPGLNGIETIKKIWAIDPDIQMVICTAYSDYSWEKTVSELGLNDNLLILKKPFDTVAVRQMTCALIKKWQLFQDMRSYSSMLTKQVESRTASLQESLSLVKATLESSSDGILVLNNKNEIIDYNQKFKTMWLVPRKLLVEKNEKNLRLFMQDKLKNPEAFLQDLSTLLDDLFDTKINKINFKDGRIFEYYSQPQKIREQMVGRVFSFRDITKRAKLEEKLAYQARHDTLTGLPNRLVLLEKMKEFIKNPAKNKSFVLLFLDIDRFKLINDSFNHEVGDEVLKVTARRLQRLIRADDILARLGGDEFVLIFNGINTKVQVLEKVHKLQEAFKEPFRIGQRQVTVSASIGISMFPKDGKTANLLLRNADAAMYRSKERNTAQFYTNELNTRGLEQLEKETELHQALVNKEFYLCYQPQFDIKTGSIKAVEALIRWNHPKHGMLLPIEFIPLCEKTGLIVVIGEWVIKEACQQIKAWEAMGIIPPRMAVNMSAQQFLSQNICKLVQEILEETQIDPSYLEIELTENTIANHPEIIHAAHQLKDMGVTISIDDFGTGYSSLSYLKQIPLNRLKIDSSFIKNIQSATDDEVIIRAIISIAKHLNLEVVAEGVENNHQFNFLKHHGCDNIQGYFFSKPLTKEEIEGYLRQPPPLHLIE